MGVDDAGVSRAEAPKEIARLKQGSGGDLLMFGSATTWNPLLAEGLVDELIVLVGRLSSVTDPSCIRDRGQA
ncbi:dihydrofolate reductase family protein [Fodinicola acaciae]|uniref:dihydrofolate reductase family protein n=1 Tax=Fodinicola acaciae TaxID=2681555 RepID=UPI0013D32105|nr:dihydrofolate reductase family protein [Fodinicola acaciae]